MSRIRGIFTATIAAMALTPACRRDDAAPGRDAGPVVAAPTKTARQRVAANGEVLADLDKSAIRLAIVKDHDATAPVVATMSLRDGVLSTGDPALSFARLTFDLSTFDSGVPMRNDRVKQFFFETSAGDTAELVARPLPEAALAGLREKKPVVHTKVEGDLTLHGRTAKVTLPLDVGVDARGTIWVKTAKPIEVKISDFGLRENSMRLMRICMHESIDDVVKIEASLEFPER